VSRSIPAFFVSEHAIQPHCNLQGHCGKHAVSATFQAQTNSGHGCLQAAAPVVARGTDTCGEVPKIHGYHTMIIDGTYPYRQGICPWSIGGGKEGTNVSQPYVVGAMRTVE
jgi:hypothetical protein